MDKSRTDSNVIEFVQSETKTKTFRLDYPVSDELRKVMVDEIFSDFKDFALDLYYDDYRPLLMEYVDEHRPRTADKKYGLLKNIFWWRMLYECSINLKENPMVSYITANHHEFRKRPFVKSWLRECSKQIPKFYYVLSIFSNRKLSVMDIMTQEILDVVICEPLSTPPIQGEVILGTLMPMGGGLHFPVVDFYHFDYEAREKIVPLLGYYYDKYLKNSTMHEAFIHVLSTMLQIERIVCLDNLENTSSK